MDSVVMFLNKREVKLLAFTLSILISLSNYLWGIWLPDNFYWIELASRWQDSGMCALSMWGMHVWHGIFGNTLFANRMLAWILNISIVFILYLGLLKKHEWGRWLYYLSGALVIMGPGISKCCTPDCFTSVLGALLLVLSIRLSNARKLQWLRLLVLSVLTGLCIAVRFPNILFIPVIALYIMFATSDCNYKWRQALVYIVLSCTIYWLVLFSLFDDVHCISRIFADAAESASESNGRHSLLGLILRYCKSVLLSMIAICVMVGTWRFLEKIKLKNSFVCVLLATCIISLAIYEVMSHIGMGYHSWSVCLVSLDAVLLGHSGFKEWKKKNNKCIYLFLFLLVMPFIPSAGSDTGFQKSMMMACGLAPIVMAYSAKYIEKRLCLNVFYVSSMVISVFIFSEELKYVNAQANNKFISKVWLADWQIKRYDEIAKQTTPYFKQDKTIFYGFEYGHYLYCYFNTKVLYNAPFWMEKNDEKAIKCAIEVMPNDSDNIFIDLTKSDESYFTENGLRCVKKDDNFCVYKYDLIITK